MNDFELNCMRCKLEFDTMIKIPKMIINCGHTLCNQCLLDLSKQKKPYVCPEDKKVT